MIWRIEVLRRLITLGFSVVMKNPSIRDIAKACGVSPSGVSAALRDRPNISADTKRRVLESAANLGYQTDPRLNQLMAYLRSAKGGAAGTNVAWLYDTEFEDDIYTKVWESGYLLGARKRAERFGYHLNIIWARSPEYSVDRIGSILKARGIEGIIVFQPTDFFPWNIPLDWNDFAVSAIEGNHSGKKIPRVISHTYEEMRDIMIRLLKLGYSRPGLVMGGWINETNDYYWRGGFIDAQDLLEKENRLVPLIEENWNLSLHEWIERTHPDVIVCGERDVLNNLIALGYRVPEDLALIHLNITAHVADWSGINNVHELLGEAAFDMMVGQINRWETGLRPNPRTMYVQGDWQDGWTCPQKLPQVASV